MLFRDQHVERWNDEEREDRSDRHATDQDQTDRISRGSAGPGHESERKVTGDGGDARHHDRAQTNARGLGDGLKFRQALSLQFVRELHNQNSVLGNEADQRDQTDLRIDVERRRPTDR